MSMYCVHNDMCSYAYLYKRLFLYDKLSCRLNEYVLCT